MGKVRGGLLRGQAASMENFSSRRAAPRPRRTLGRVRALTRYSFRSPQSTLFHFDGGSQVYMLRGAASRERRRSSEPSALLPLGRILGQNINDWFRGGRTLDLTGHNILRINLFTVNRLIKHRYPGSKLCLSAPARQTHPCCESNSGSWLTLRRRFLRSQLVPQPRQLPRRPLPK